MTIDPDRLKFQIEEVKILYEKFRLIRDDSFSFKHLEILWKYNCKR